MKPGSLLIPVIAVSIVSLIIFGCSKSGSGSKPQITLISIDKNPVNLNDSLVVHFKFSNGGKVENGYFISIRNRINEAPPSDASGNDTLVNPIPDLEGASKGEFRYALETNGYLSESTSIHQNDTIIMKYFVLSASGD
ncbi:MAG TPA: hypothetical protein VN824_18480, partial [Puia sp.]|nr:hypothetical protein [Puia sp.]